jgi:tetratricopeptide (TPR) repeat protein
MDADDRVARESREELAALLRSLPDENVAYLMNVLSPAPDGGPMFETLHARVFRNDPRLRWRYAVHEQIVPSVLRAGGQMRETAVQIVHVGYTASVLPGKMERNLRLVDRALEQSPLDGYLLTCRAGVLADLGRSGEALVSLNLCEIAYARRTAPPNVFALRARAYAMEADLLSALESVGAGLSHHPCDAQLLFLQAGFFAALGRYDEAEVCLRAQLLVGDQHARFECADRTIVPVRTRHLLAELLLHIGRFAEAEREARRITEDRPSYGFAWLTLGQALLALGKDEAFEAMEQALGTSHDSEVGRTVLGAARLRRDGRPADARALVERAQVLHPRQTVLLKASLAALWDANVGAEPLDKAVQEALVADPTCMHAWAIRRALLARANTKGGVDRRACTPESRQICEYPPFCCRPPV